MIRRAMASDAEQLGILNMEFNGVTDRTTESIRESLENNRQEMVIVHEENGQLTGFVCVQIKKSFCYNEWTAEVTEVYVRPEHRRQGIASRMIAFAECLPQVTRMELLTGSKNLTAQAVYAKLGYTADQQRHMTKRIGK